MSNESLNPYAPPETNPPAEQPSAFNPEANLEILRLAMRSMIVALFALVAFPAAFLVAPLAIYQAQNAKELIDRTGAGRQYGSTATGAIYISYFALILFVGFIVMFFV